MLLTAFVKEKRKEYLFGAKMFLAKAGLPGYRQK